MSQQPHFFEQGYDWVQDSAGSQEYDSSSHYPPSSGHQQFDASDLAFSGYSHTVGLDQPGFPWQAEVASCQTDRIAHEDPTYESSSSEKENLTSGSSYSITEGESIKKPRRHQNHLFGKTISKTESGKSSDDSFSFLEALPSVSHGDPASCNHDTSRLENIRFTDSFNQQSQSPISQFRQANQSFGGTTSHSESLTLLTRIHEDDSILVTTRSSKEATKYAKKKCPMCPKTYHCILDLGEHFVVHTKRRSINWADDHQWLKNVVENLDTNRKDNAEKFICVQCKETRIFHCEQDLREHSRGHSQPSRNRKLLCPITNCDRHFPQSGGQLKQDLKDHIARRHMKGRLSGGTLDSEATSEVKELLNKATEVLTR